MIILQGNNDKLKKQYHRCLYTLIYLVPHTHTRE